MTNASNLYKKYNLKLIILFYFMKRLSLFCVSEKVKMGYKKVYLWGTDFCGVQKVKMGYCTPKWGTVGSPASNTQLKEIFFSHSLLIVVIMTNILFEKLKWSVDLHLPK